MENEEYLDTPLLRFPDGSEWTIRHAVCGTAYFGGIGGGKSSIAKTLALKYLDHGFGGLVLSAKDELETWRDYCKQVGREKDLIVVHSGGKYHFDPLAWECQQNHSGTSITKNLVALLDTVITAGKDRSSSGTENSQFWQSAQTMLLNSAVDLCLIAYKTVSVQMLYDIILSAPKGGHSNTEADTPYKQAFVAAHKNTGVKINEYLATLSEPEKERLEESDTLDATIMKNVPDYRTLTLANQFFSVTFKDLPDKTRHTVEFSFQAFLQEMLREPFYSLFASGKSNFSPQDALDGKIVLIHMPVKHFHQTGRDIQIALKYCFTRAWERRNIQESSKPTFLWMDEAQEFIAPTDASTQATARASRICAVFITQNLAGCHAAMGGGNKSEHRVTQLLGTLATKFFCANADIDTNKFASDLIGEDYTADPSTGFTMAKDVTLNISESQRLHKRVRPETFATLSCGGPKNDLIVEAYMHIQGSPFADGRNYKKIRFKQ